MKRRRDASASASPAASVGDNTRTATARSRRTPPTTSGGQATRKKSSNSSRNGGTHARTRTTLQSSKNVPTKRVRRNRPKSKISSSDDRAPAASSSSYSGKNKTNDEMPDPPASLVKLLQRDKKVLHYFTCLQNNLTLDVKRWKDRAMEYRSQLKQLQAEVEEMKRNVKIRDSSTDMERATLPMESIHVPKESMMTMAMMDDKDDGHGSHGGGDSDSDDDRGSGTFDVQENENDHENHHINFRNYSHRGDDDGDRSQRHTQSIRVNDPSSNRKSNGAQSVHENNTKTKDGRNSKDDIDAEFFADSESQSSDGASALSPSSSSSADAFDDIEKEFEDQFFLGSNENQKEKEMLTKDRKNSKDRIRNGIESDELDSVGGHGRDREGDLPLPKRTQQLHQSLASLSSSESTSSFFDDFEKEFEEHMNAPEEEEVQGERDAIRKQILEHLIAAHDNLRSMGIHLVDVVPPDDDKMTNEDVEHGHKDELMNGNQNDREDGTYNPILASTTKDSNGKMEKNQDLDKIESELMKQDSSDSEEDDDEAESFGFGVIQCASKSKNGEASAAITISSEKQRPTISKRSDDDVIKDIMRAIRSLIRRPTLDAQISRDCDEIEKSRYQPFLSSALIPACYDVDIDTLESGKKCCDETNEAIPQHPLAEGLRLILRALTVMDTYCETNSFFCQRHDWEQLYSGTTDSEEGCDDEMWEKLECIRIGLRSRNITSMIVSSLDGEIARCWAVADRAARLTSTALIYETNDGQDNDSGMDDTGIGNLVDKMEVDGTQMSSNSVCTFSAKNQNRLFLLVERICHCRIVSYIYQHRRDIQAAAQLVIDYILSTSPSIQVENYPRFAPAMSFCVLEALLRPKASNDSDVSNKKTWFSIFLDLLCTRQMNEMTDCCSLRDSLSCAVHTSARVWSQRLNSDDRRVKEISRVEIAAYDRIVKQQTDWLANMSDTPEDEDGEDETSLKIDDVFEKLIQLDTIGDHNGDEREIPISACISLQASLLLNGSIENIIRYCGRVVELLQSKKGVRKQDQTIGTMSPLFISCFVAGATLQRLRWEANCLSGMSMIIVRNEISDENRLGSKIDGLIEICSKREIDSSDLKQDKPNEILSITNLPKLIFQCCALLGDGRRAYKMAYLMCKDGNMWSGEERKVLKFIYPVVRVINLKCREDRWRQFSTQAQRSQFLTVLGVISLSNTKSLDPTIQSPSLHNDTLWGLNAYSGKDSSHLMFEHNMSSQIDETKSLRDYVSTHWRPSELAQFDSNARSDDSLVRMSVSERACALSHISSWEGVKNSLRLEEIGIGRHDHHSEEAHLLQLFRISGFAQGPAFVIENEAMDPSPVCIIMEDDAMLVDQFNDRLADILKELPRDFHFCSIGYSRPKNAPMIQYSKHIGIPTCLWYLTGYILSLEGAKRLLNSLPVQGPVDSWIGMQMAGNWGNEYGSRIGVGNAPKASVDMSSLPNRKQLGCMMKFRAFAATAPLCSQKLSWKNTLSTREKARWRERDTDVTYSGHL